MSPATTTRRCRAPARQSKSRTGPGPNQGARACAGVVTDLRTDVGHYAQPGAPVMTLIAMHDLWISADLTENNLGNIEPGDKVAIVLDILPGEVLKGRVRSIGGGVAGSQPPPPGTCLKCKTVATGCAQRNAYRSRSSSTRPSCHACVLPASAARPRCLCIRMTTRS